MTDAQSRAEREIEQAVLLDTVKAAVKEAFVEVRALDSATHNQHHDWLRARIAKEQERTQFWAELRRRTFPYIVWGLLSTAAAWAWAYITKHWS